MDPLYRILRLHEREPPALLDGALAIERRHRPPPAARLHPRERGHPGHAERRPRSRALGPVAPGRPLDEETAASVASVAPRPEPNPPPLTPRMSRIATPGGSSPTVPPFERRASEPTPVVAARGEDPREFPREFPRDPPPPRRNPPPPSLPPSSSLSPTGAYIPPPLTGFTPVNHPITVRYLKLTSAQNSSLFDPREAHDAVHDVAQVEHVGDVLREARDAALLFPAAAAHHSPSSSYSLVGNA